MAPTRVKHDLVVFFVCPHKSSLQIQRQETRDMFYDGIWNMLIYLGGKPSTTDPYSQRTHPPLRRRGVCLPSPAELGKRRLSFSSHPKATTCLHQKQALISVAAVAVAATGGLLHWALGNVLFLFFLPVLELLIHLPQRCWSQPLVPAVPVNWWRHHQAARNRKINQLVILGPLQDRLHMNRAKQHHVWT